MFSSWYYTPKYNLYHIGHRLTEHIYSIYPFPSLLLAEYISIYILQKNFVLGSATGAVTPASRNGHMLAQTVCEFRCPEQRSVLMLSVTGL